MSDKAQMDRFSPLRNKDVRKAKDVSRPRRRYTAKSGGRPHIETRPPPAQVQNAIGNQASGRLSDESQKQTHDAASRQSTGQTSSHQFRKNAGQSEVIHSQGAKDYKADAGRYSGPKTDAPRPFEVGGDTTSSKVIRIAWTFDDGPTSKTPIMKKAIGLSRTTWFVEFSRIRGKSAKEEIANLSALKQTQDIGGEIAIHSYHKTKGHVAWFPMSTRPSYSNIDTSLRDLEIFYRYLKAAKINVKFARLPYGLISELVQWLKDKSVPKSNTVARKIIDRRYDGNDRRALAVKAGFERTLRKLYQLGLHLWSGSSGTKPEIGRGNPQSWEAESSGVAARSDNITEHVSSGRKSNPASLRDNPGKFERLTDRIALDGKARSLVVLAHDTTEADVAEVAADKSKMNEYAKTKSVKIEYFTLSGLYAVIRDKAP